MRAIFEFSKSGRLRFISHLDLQRFMMRAVRRTDLPVSYSQGFNPHPHMSFASALAMGWSSDVELMDIRLTEDVVPEHALQQMQSALPAEMPVHRCRIVSDRFPALMASLVMADYRVELSGTYISKVIDFIPSYLSLDTVMAVRKTKSGEKDVNIRPLTIALSAGDQRQLYMRLMLTPDETLKPDLLMDTIIRQCDAMETEYSIFRTALLGRDAEGNIVPLMELSDE